MPDLTLRDQMAADGFRRAGAIYPVDTEQVCQWKSELEFPGYATYLVVVGDQVMKHGKTKNGVSNRLRGYASALRRIMINPQSRRRDPFKRLAPDVIRGRQEIEVWGRPSTADDYNSKIEERLLCEKYDTKKHWAVRAN